MPFKWKAILVADEEGFSGFSVVDDSALGILYSA